MLGPSYKTIGGREGGTVSHVLIAPLYSAVCLCWPELSQMFIHFLTGSACLLTRSGPARWREALTAPVRPLIPSRASVGLGS